MKKNKSVLVRCLHQPSEQIRIQTNKSIIKIDFGLIKGEMEGKTKKKTSIYKFWFKNMEIKKLRYWEIQRICPILISEGECGK